MARKRKSRSLERPEIESRKLDKALAAVLAAEVKSARAVWEEDRTCRRQLSKLRRSKNPNAAEIAKTEIESLKKQATIMSGFRGQQVMGDGGGARTRVDPADPALLFHVDPPPIITTTIFACSEQIFRPPYARGVTSGLHFLPVTGIDGQMIAERKTGNLMANCKIFGNGASLKVTAGFWIDFSLDMPSNPWLLTTRTQDRPLRFGHMRIIAIFFPLLTAFEVAARELGASSSGSISLIVATTATGPWPLWHTRRLWKKSAVDTGEFNPLRDSRYEERRVFISPWFGADSITKYSAYVGVSVDVEGDLNPQDPNQFGFAFGSIGGELGAIKIEQCLLP